MSRMHSQIDAKPTQRMVEQDRNAQLEIGKRIDDLGELHDLLKTTPERGPYTKLCLSRIMQLMVESLNKPLTNEIDNLLWHSEVRGRLIEQIRNVNVLPGIKARQEILEAKKQTLIGRITGHLKTMSKGKQT